MYDQNSGQLVDGYNRMMDRIKSAIYSQPDDDAPSLKFAMDKAIETATKYDELTEKQARQVANTIKRDLNDVAETLMESSEDFTEWLKLDIDMLEKRVLDLFLSAADNTRYELKQFTRQPSGYTKNNLS